MSYRKIMILLLLAFLAGGALAFFFGLKYFELVRYFFVSSTDGNIRFAGKYFPAAPDAAFIFYCATFLCLTVWCLYQHKWNSVLLYIAIIILLFFGATYISASVDAIGRIAQCSACTDEEKALRNDNINYNLHLLVAFSVSILPIARFIPGKKKL